MGELKPGWVVNAWAIIAFKLDQLRAKKSIPEIRLGGGDAFSSRSIQKTSSNTIWFFRTRVNHESILTH